MARHKGKLWKMLSSGAISQSQAIQIMLNKGYNKLNAKKNVMISHYDQATQTMPEHYSQATGKMTQHYDLLPFPQGWKNNYDTAITKYAVPDYRDALPEARQHYQEKAPVIPERWKAAFGAMLGATTLAPPETEYGHPVYTPMYTTPSGIPYRP